MTPVTCLEAGLRSSPLSEQDQTIRETGMSSVTCTTRGFFVVNAMVREAPAARITSALRGSNLRLRTIAIAPCTTAAIIAPASAR